MTSETKVNIDPSLPSSPVVNSVVPATTGSSSTTTTVPNGPFVDPPPHVRQHPLAVLLRLPLHKRVQHPFVEDDLLVLARRPLVQHPRPLRRRHPVLRPVHHQERRRHLGELRPHVLAHPRDLPHGPHPRPPRVPPRVRRDHPQLPGVAYGLPDHVVLRHRLPRVGGAEEEAEEEEAGAGGLHVLRDHEEGRGEDEPRPEPRRGLEVDEGRHQPAEGLAEEEGRDLARGGAGFADGAEEGEGGGGDGVEVAEVAAEAVGAAVAEEVGDVDGVAPGGEGDGDLLEEPAGVGAVAVGHEDEGLGVVVGAGAEGAEGLGEEALAGGGREVGLAVAHSLRRVVLGLVGLVAPKILCRHFPHFPTSGMMSNKPIVGCL
ncbi:putative caffeoylshikimate esterase [Iris pallida]|uniref:Caffeoylshikimate esterase n=1 Tax=Iris pallida TaxID=29817 RepID=A0AAX6F719_IRIPA|nr:putative caffeoylshikimate esterase [Iris pallida]